jgi:hypothetical protein
MAGEMSELHIFCQEFEQLFVRFAEQIGRGEIFVENEQLFPVGTPVKIVFFLAYDDLPFFHITGTVSNVVETKQKKSGGGQPGGMNIKIEQMDEKVRSFMVNLVKYQLKSELSRLFTT